MAMAPHILIGLDLGKVATRIAYTRADSPSFSEADTPEAIVQAFLDGTIVAGENLCDH